MNNTTKISIMIVVLTSMGTVTSLHASAASTKAEQWDAEGTINFTPNTTTPPDITNPDAPGETGDGGTPGALAIDYASELGFGSHQLSATTATYYANPDAKEFSKPVGDFVEIHDLRGLGAGNPTQLSVTQVAQFNNGTSDLAGASLSFSSGMGENVTGGGYVPTSVSSFTLTPGTAQMVMSTDGTVGQFLTSYGSAADYKGTEVGGPISLNIPSGKALTGSYTTTLQWDLTTAP